MALPEFRMHGFDRKFEPLPNSILSQPYPSVTRMVNLIQAMVGGDVGKLTILDVGSGRGELVAELRRLGASAFGIEIDPRFVKSGELLEQRYHDKWPILSVVNDHGQSVFPSRFFDVVVSDQVLEHVADLTRLATEIERVLRPGGLTFHQFPARFKAVEPHYKLPFVHWLPKGGLRRMAIGQLLRIGFSRQFFPEFDVTDRTEIIFKYSVEETFYRPRGEIENAFMVAGLAPSSEGMNTYAVRRAGLLGRAPLFARIVAATRMMTVTARKAA
jgi:SAM-dependent methyltransferase